jgi:hypothetical protein
LNSFSEIFTVQLRLQCPLNSSLLALKRHGKDYIGVAGDPFSRTDERRCQDRVALLQVQSS